VVVSEESDGGAALDGPRAARALAVLAHHGHVTAGPHQHTTRTSAPASMPRDTRALNGRNRKHNTQESSIPSRAPIRQNPVGGHYPAPPFAPPW
jgi:hypothetical protein